MKTDWGKKIPRKTFVIPPNFEILISITSAAWSCQALTTVFKSATHSSMGPFINYIFLSTVKAYFSATFGPKKFCFGFEINAIELLVQNKTIWTDTKHLGPLGLILHFLLRAILLYTGIPWFSFILMFWKQFFFFFRIL